MQYFISKFLCGKARKHTKDDDYDYGKGDKNDVFGEPKKGRKKMKMKKKAHKQKVVVLRATVNAVGDVSSFVRTLEGTV